MGIDMGNYENMRIESIRRKKYMLKQLKNKSAKSFLTIYINSKGEVTENLRKAACLYKRAHFGRLDTDISNKDLERITDEEINEIHGKIKDRATGNFVKFYESYRRKIDLGYYDQNIVNSAFGDLKTAYSTYRMSNNPLWNLEEEQITEDEMSNLYNVLVPQTEGKPNTVMNKEEK